MGGLVSRGAVPHNRGPMMKRVIAAAGMVTYKSFQSRVVPRIDRASRRFE
jgi:hypothetical protein